MDQYVADLTVWPMRELLSYSCPAYLDETANERRGQVFKSTTLLQWAGVCRCGGSELTTVDTEGKVNRLPRPLWILLWILTWQKVNMLVFFVALVTAACYTSCSSRLMCNSANGLMLPSVNKGSK